MTERVSDEVLRRWVCEHADDQWLVDELLELRARVRRAEALAESLHDLGVRLGMDERMSIDADDIVEHVRWLESVAARGRDDD